MRETALHAYTPPMQRPDPASLPVSPGVYLYKDAKGRIIYVGKARVLRRRVLSYFRPEGLPAKTRAMLAHAVSLDVLTTTTEKEALLLESSLIKKHRPHYNIVLRDDKQYVLFRIDPKHPFPRLEIVRKARRDGARYFGPFTSALAARETWKLLHRAFALRRCSDRAMKNRVRPCLYHHMGQCPAPCMQLVDSRQYYGAVHKVIELLEGKSAPLLARLRQEMEKASEALEFERAIEYRELIGSVKKIAQKQKITDSSGEDRDVLAVASKDEDAVVQVFFIRGGRLIGRDHFYLRISKGESASEILNSFIMQYYAGTPFIPAELMLQDEVEDREVLEEWLSSRRGQKVALRVPKKGAKEKLVELAQQNAEMVLAKDKERLRREEGRTIGAVKEIAALLGTGEIVRMEAFDISNTNGLESVGSMVVYERGRPKRNDYRKFRIKGIKGADDYGSMREVLTRRFTHGLKEREESAQLGKFTVFPDLILMDGGKGQVNVALQVLDELHLDIPVCGMVKDDRHRTRGLYYHNEEIPIDRNSEAFRLVTRIQDEAHRFAIEYHRQLRGRGQVHSILDDIDGIGPARRKALMRTYQSLDDIKQASVEELAKIPSMNEKAAESVYKFFH